MSFISIIIPVYKQGRTIKKDIESIKEALSTLAIPFEIVPVIDGDLDNSKKEAMKIKDPRVHVVGYKTNHGKGYAVRYGFAHAKGDIIGFMDAGGDLKASALPLMIIKFLYEKADVVIGSKRHPDSEVIYPWVRKVFSWVYQKIVKFLFGLDVTDTQVGMKIYKRKLLEDVLPRMLVKQFAFDIEILAVAYHLGYRRIYESPVEIRLNTNLSSIVPKKMISIIYNMLKDTLAVFYRLKILHYYDEGSKRKWRFDPELNFRVNVG